MAQPKGALRLAGRAVLSWHVARLAEVSSVVVAVLGAGAADLRPLLPAEVRVVVNEDWEHTWPADSLRLALEAIDWRGPCWVTPVDVPPPRRQTLQDLLRAGPPCVPVGPDARPGHPVLLDAGTVAAVRHAAPAGGLRTLLATSKRVSVADPLVSTDFDDTEAFEALRARWRDG